MSTYKSYTFSSGKSFTERLLGSLIFLVFIGLLFYLFYQLYLLMWYAVPVFLLIALLLEYRVVLGYFRNLWAQIADNPLGGLIQMGINVVGFPFVTLGLIFKAWMYKKFGRIQQDLNQQPDEAAYTHYEEVEPDQPDAERPKQRVIADGRYDDLFE
ncbi:MAG TPA: hypothetical protein VFX48_03770 [Saprospiraceae bacterium]|nr:hypothetical protein [Saprospiraceae bacterium]